MINDLVTFEATNAEELETNFHNVVDDYLQTCEELGREPQKTFKGVFNVRIDSLAPPRDIQRSVKIMSF